MIENLFIKVIEASFLGSIAGLIILLIRCILKNKINSKWIYLLWMIVIIKLMVPFGPESNLSIFNKINSIKFSTSINNNYDKNIAETTDNNINIIKGDYENTATNYDSSKNLVNNISYIWLTICISLSLVFTSSYFIMKNKIKEKSFYYDGSLDKVLTQCKAKLKIKRNIKIVINDYIKTPAIIGIFQPTILIPINTLEFKQNEIEYIFIHELSHLKRNDNIINLLLTMNQSIHWFNPFIWYMSKIIRQDMELATDELVLSRINNNEYKNYGFTILNISSSLNKYKTSTRVIGMSNDKKSLEDRIRNIKLMDKINKRKKIYTVMGAILVLTMGIFIITSPKENGKLMNSQLSKTQNLYFELVNNIEEKNIDYNEAKSIINNLKFENVVQEKESIVIKEDNENIEITLSNNNISILEYKNDKNIVLSFMNANEAKEIGSEEKYSMRLENLSAENLGEVMKNINPDIAKNKLFKSYLDVLQLAGNNKITKEEVLKIDSTLSQPEGKNQLQNTLSSKDDDYNLSSVYNSEGNLLNMSFANNSYNIVFDINIKNNYSNQANFNLQDEKSQKNLIEIMN